MKRNLDNMFNNRILMLNYAKNYFSAISKLATSNSEKYDENGILRHEYELTSEEREAICCYINNNTSKLSKVRR